MFTQRYSCDRCRQQKVRCLKNWELPTADGGSGSHLTPCERCTKAEVPCVYSMRQRNRRARRETFPSPKENTQLSQDLSSVLSSTDVAGHDLNDLIIPSFDTTIHCIDEGDAYNWNDNLIHLYDRDNNDKVHEFPGISQPLSRDDSNATMTEQLMSLINRATSTTRELACQVITAPLTVNSTVVNEAFEVANALVRIINSIPLASSTYDSLEHLSREEGERQPPAEHSLIFLALASHQHVLTLFRAVCKSIQKSLESMIQGTEPQYQALHGAGATSAQFIMILQLIIHLVNRIGRSLRMAHRKHSDSSVSTFGLEDGGENGGSQSIVDSAQGLLKILPDEHLKLSQLIEELQARIEDRSHV